MIYFVFIVSFVNIGSLILLIVSVLAEMGFTAGTKKRRRKKEEFRIVK